MSSLSEINEIIETLRLCAIRYYQLTGKPVGITAEIGEHDAARLLGLTLSGARQEGYDALKPDGTRVQIKTRALEDAEIVGSHRVGAIKLDHEWDSIMLVLMGRDYQTVAIHEVARSTIEHAIMRTESKARRAGKLSVAEIIRIGRQVWPVA